MGKRNLEDVKEEDAKGEDVKGEDVNAIVELKPLPPKKLKTKVAKTKQPVTEMMYTINFRKIDRSPGNYKVRLSVPSPEEECPLTLDPMLTSDVEFLPGVAFLRKFPNLKKMTLPCGHSFGAMPLFYHMCKNNLMCPCCRQGEEGAIYSETIPIHFRKEVLDRIQALSAKDQEEEEREQMEQILAIESYSGSFEDMANRGNLSISLEFANNPGSGPPSAIFVFHILLTPWGGGNSVFRPTASQMLILPQLRNLSDTVAITAQMHIPGLGTAQLETTGPISVRRSVGRVSVRGSRNGSWVNMYRHGSVPESISTFDMDFEALNGESFLSSVSWRPDSPYIRWMAAQP
jgi:hypothetical protein